MRRKLIVLVLAAAILLVASPVIAADPIVDLTEAVAYWQEQAVQLAVERDRLEDELARLTEERNVLLEDRAMLEVIAERLQSERDEAMGLARAEGKLRQDAERDIELAMDTIESLHAAIKRLAGPRFGIILGATRDFQGGNSEILAAVQIMLQ